MVPIRFVSSLMRRPVPSGKQADGSSIHSWVAYSVATDREGEWEGDGGEEGLTVRGRVQLDRED